MSSSRFAHFAGRVFNTYTNIFFLKSESGNILITKPEVILGGAAGGSLLGSYMAVTTERNPDIHDIALSSGFGFVIGGIWAAAFPFILPVAGPIYISSYCMKLASQYSIVKTK